MWVKIEIIVWLIQFFFVPLHHKQIKEIMKRFKIINGKKHKAIGYTYDGKPIGWIACGEND